ncbi:MAG: SsrA-binding protein SmpB [Mycoplasmataceae bacterium]|jgi:SsrA-binding protein|nr:SsrA-binding protein SmpB [Mycoplasmataceae bacterium]
MKILFTNKKFSRNYQSETCYECGIVLSGNEIKSVAEANATIDDAFGVIRNGQIYLINMYIAPYTHANTFTTINTTRKRKLLLHKTEIERIDYLVKKNKFLLIPNKVYFLHHKIKIELCLSKHKNSRDKRFDLKKRDMDRESKKIII